MRKIKFRAWNINKKEMRISPDEIQHLGSWFDAHLPGALANVENIKIMQFAGFLDELKSEIFEGDLFDGFGEGIKYFEVRFEKGEVVLYNNYGKWGTLDRFFKIASDYKIAVIVRGNICENPELLS